MKCSQIIYCLMTVTLAYLCSTKVKAGCPKQLGRRAPLNPQKPTKGQEPQICSRVKTCCTQHMEKQLSQKAVSDLKRKVIKRLDAFKGSTSVLRQETKGYFEEIVLNAKLDSLSSLKQSHANLSRLGAPLVKTFFNQVKDSIENHHINFTHIVLQFLRDSFPPLFNYATGQSKKFSNHFEKCLKDNTNNKQLFGSAPYRIANNVKSILKPMQLFVKGFKFAGEVIENAKKLNFTKGCSPILLQMSFCSMCQAEDSTIKPCESYCIDVLKNCLLSSAQLQRHWWDYFNAMDKLATSLSRTPIKDSLYQVYNDLSMAVLQVIPQLHDPSLKTAMFTVCGQPTFASGAVNPATTTQNQKVKISLKEKMEKSKVKMISLRNSFEEMPRVICIQDRVSALRTEKVVVANCWNGTSVGRYYGPVSSPLPSLESTPADTFRINKLVIHINNFMNDIKKHTNAHSTEGEGSAVYSGGGSGCDENDIDCYSSASGSGKEDPTGENDIREEPTTDDIYFTKEPNDVQGGGVNADVKAGGRGEGTMLASSLSLVLLLTSFISFWI